MTPTWDQAVAELLGSLLLIVILFGVPVTFTLISDVTRTSIRRARMRKRSNHRVH